MEEEKEIPRSIVFLHILTRTSISEFKKFMTCLSSDGQDHVANLLEVNAGLSINSLHRIVKDYPIYFARCST